MANENNSKIEFTFDFSQDNFSKLELKKTVFSRQYSVADVTWTLGIAKNVAEESKKHVLSSYLYAEGETKLWCCYVRVRLTICNIKKGILNRSRYFEHLLSSACKNRGYSEFIDWDTVTNPTSGYIKDDTVKFQVHIVADPPQNVDQNYVKVTAAPVTSEGWLSVFEDRINKQIVCRVSEEFKKVVSSVEEGFNSVNSKNDDLKEDIQDEIVVIKEDISTVKEDIATVKKDISSMKDRISSVNSAIDELKNLLLKKDKKKDEGKVHDGCEKENKNQREEMINSHKTEVIEDFVVRKLSEFKHEMMNDYFLHQSPESRISCSIPPWYGYNEPFPRTNYGRGYGYESEYGRHLGKFSLPYESVPHNQKKRIRTDCRCSTSSSSITHRLHEIGKYLEKDDGNESDSADASRYGFIQPPILSNSSIPSEEEALEKNIDLNRPWRKELILVGKDGDGKQETHKATCLNELYELKKKFKECEVFEAEKVQLP